MLDAVAGPNRKRIHQVRGKLPGTSFLGPAFGHLMTLLSGITGHAGVDQVMNRSVPFVKYI
jgi:hypothetical protein